MYANIYSSYAHVYIPICGVRLRGRGKSPAGNNPYISGVIGDLFNARNIFKENRIQAIPTAKAKNNSMATSTTTASYPIGERA
jgi:hypothetical protein